MSLLPLARRPAILSRLSDAAATATTVGELLLPGMEAYARVLNPVRTSEAGRIRWSETGAARVDSRTQWSDLVARNAKNPEGELNVSTLRPPETGGIDPVAGEALAEVLMAHTTTPEECLFLVWEGYAGLLPEVRSAVTVEIAPHSRRMHALSGTLADATESMVEPPSRRLPMWWIPQDGAWCVGNDIYGRSVFVGGTAEAISAVIADPRLEAYATGAYQLLINEDF